MTVETATSALHFLHHLSHGVYLQTLLHTVFHEHFAGPDTISNTVDVGTHLNPAIFTALRQARGGRGAELYVRDCLVYGQDVGANVFAGVSEEDLKFHSIDCDMP